MYYKKYMQGRRKPIKLSRGPISRKNVGHQGWLTEKILGFEWPKTAQMALKFLFFPGIFLNMHRGFFVCQNNFCKPFSFYKDFSWKIYKIKHGLFQSETM